MMKRVTVAAILVIGLVPAGALAQKTGTLTPADYEDIRNLYATYSVAADTGDGAAYAATFTVDGVFVVGTRVVAEGRDKIRANRNPVPAGKPVMKHTPTNIMIEPTAEGAKGFCYAVLMLLEPGKPLAVGSGGEYEDTLVKTAEGWRFKKRIFSPWSLPAAPVSEAPK